MPAKNKNYYPDPPTVHQLVMICALSVRVDLQNYIVGATISMRIPV